MSYRLQMSKIASKELMRLPTETVRKIFPKIKARLTTPARLAVKNSKAITKISGAYAWETIV